ncbi:hypothetical protein ACVWZA_004394 [Sphingomonas sp. UYAg733]
MTDAESTPGSTQSVETGNDVAVVTQVVLAERQCRDRGWWDQMAAQYWPDSNVRLSWYTGDGAGFVAGSQAMAASGEVSYHRVFAPVVHLRGDRALVEVPVALRLEVQVDEVSGDLVSYMRLPYRLERRGGIWRIVSLDAIYEYTTLTPLVPGQVINIPVGELAPYRSSYAILAWNAARLGNSLKDDDFGDDRPEEIAALYASASVWLHAASSTPV